MEVALRYWSCIYIKISIFGSKVPLRFVHTGKWQIRRIRTSMIFSLFGSRLGLLHLVILREPVFGEDYVLKFCRGTYSEV